MVKEFFNGKESNIKVNPDEAVAFGAAIQADILSNNGFEILLIDVNSLALGVRVSDGSMSELILRRIYFRRNRASVSKYPKVHSYI